MKTILCYRDKDGKYIEKDKQVSSFVKLKLEIQNNSKLPLRVPDRITRYDPLIAQAKKTLLRKDSEVYGYFGMRSTKHEEINIMVSETNISRALRFMNTLIKLLRSRNHELIIENNATFAVIFKEKVPVKFKEKAKIVYETDEYGWKNRKYYPSSKLSFVRDNRPYRQKEWADGKNPLEARLADILAHLELFAQKEINDRIEWGKRRKIEAEEHERQRVVQRKKSDEISKIKELINMANYWKQAQILREYITALENAGGLDLNRMDWIPWAKQKIEWFDPFSHGIDKILDDEDRNALMEELNKKEPKKTSY